MTDQTLIGAACEVIGFAAAVLAVGTAVQSYPLLPERIATHFNFHCEPNRWGPRGTILIFPVMAVLAFGALTVFNPVVGLDTIVLGPRAARDPIIATLVFTAMILLMAGVGRAMIAYNLGQTRRFSSPAFFIPVIFGVLMIALAMFLGAIAKT